MTDRILAMREDLERKNIPVIRAPEMERHVKNRVVFKPPVLPDLPNGFAEATREEEDTHQP